jgi:hypothetical protein
MFLYLAINPALNSDVNFTVEPMTSTAVDTDMSTLINSTNNTAVNGIINTVWPYYKTVLILQLIQLLISLFILLVTILLTLLLKYKENLYIQTLALIYRPSSISFRVSTDLLLSTRILLHENNSNPNPNPDPNPNPQIIIDIIFSICDPLIGNNNTSKHQNDSFFKYAPYGYFYTIIYILWVLDTNMRLWIII